MRFLVLDRTTSQTYFDAVIKHRCGPSFVRNRAEAFEQMIREQGLQFWFRFWLTFTNQHGIKELDEVNKDVPGLVECLYRGLHYHFVQASNEEAITYCWNTVFANGAPTKRILDEMYQFLEIAFGCALGEVFFKWLYAEDVSPHSKKKYWTVPAKYLQPDFKPGLMEAFMLCEWGNKFVELLGVTRTDVPWVKQLVNIPQNLFDDRKGMSLYHLEYTRSLLVRKCIDSWKVKIKNMRAALQLADNKRQTAETYLPRKSKKNNKVRFLLSDIAPEETMSEIEEEEDQDKSKEFANTNTSLMSIFPDEQNIETNCNALIEKMQNLKIN